MQVEGNTACADQQCKRMHVSSTPGDVKYVKGTYDATVCGSDGHVVG